MLWSYVTALQLQALTPTQLWTPDVTDRGAAQRRGGLGKAGDGAFFRSVISLYHFSSILQIRAENATHLRELHATTIQ